MTSNGASSLRVGFLGPLGTFTEQALLTQPDLASAELVPLPTFADVLEATETGAVDLGFLAIENSIEGTVNVTLDGLAFTHDLLIQREVVLDVELCLMARPGVAIGDITTVLSFPVAFGQCPHFLAAELPGVDVQTTPSTSAAAQFVSTSDRTDVAAIGPALAAKLYGLEVLANHVEDHDGNQTRFILVAREGVPAPTGHDKTSLVVYQKADVPGSLLAILQEFAARAINLSKIESRPTKSGGLGDYCFVFDLEGHVADEVVADCLRDLHMKQGGVRFLGSYPAAGEHGPALRRDAAVAWREANGWVAELRAQVRSPLGEVSP